MTILDEKYTEYKQAVSAFCFFAAQLSVFSKIQEQGIDPNLEKLEETLSFIKEYQEKVLALKKTLGLDGGMNFTQDNGFVGFRIKDGTFEGEPNVVKKIVQPWLDYPASGNHYLFEVACYAYFLAFPDRINLYPEKKLSVDQEGDKISESKQEKFRTENDPSFTVKKNMHQKQIGVSFWRTLKKLHILKKFIRSRS